jgi:hypothetical protein
MNVWKPVALLSMSGLVLSVGLQLAAAGPCFDQPNMQNAVASLKAAQVALQRAENNKNGWRDKALAAVNSALQLTQQGCATAP